MKNNSAVTLKWPFFLILFVVSAFVYNSNVTQQNTITYKGEWIVNNDNKQQPRNGPEIWKSLPLWHTKDLQKRWQSDWSKNSFHGPMEQEVACHKSSSMQLRQGFHHCFQVNQCFSRISNVGAQTVKHNVQAQK